MSLNTYAIVQLTFLLFHTASTDINTLSLHDALPICHMAREARGSAGRLAFFTLCLAVGVAAVVAVAGLSSSLDQGIRSRARQLLAADLVVASRAPLPPELDRALAEIPGARRTDVSETVSVVSAPGRGG